MTRTPIKTRCSTVVHVSSKMKRSARDTRARPPLRSLFELRVVQLGIKAAASEELLVGAFLHDIAVA